MPQVRGLDKYLRDRDLIKQTSLEVLKGARLGIDALSFFRDHPKIIQPDGSQVVLGGDPAISTSELSVLLDCFQRAEVSPTFVFPGISLASSNLRDQREQEQERQELLLESWRSVLDGKLNTARHKFAQAAAGHTLSAKVQQALLTSLRAQVETRCKGYQLTNSAGPRWGMEAMRAPQGAEGQLAWLSRPGPLQLTHASCGPLELLLYGCSTVILSLDFKAGSMVYVELEEVLASLQLTFLQFLDMCLLAGYGPVRTFQHVNNEKNYFRFRLAHELVNNYTSADLVFARFPEQATPEYLRVFHQGKRKLTRPVALQPGGTIATFDATEHLDYFGTTLTSTSTSTSAALVDSEGKEQIGFLGFPKALYGLVMQGVFSPALLNRLTSHLYYDR
eukprot:g38809.t1